MRIARQLFEIGLAPNVRSHSDQRTSEFCLARDFFRTVLKISRSDGTAFGRSWNVLLAGVFRPEVFEHKVRLTQLTHKGGVLSVALAGNSKPFFIKPSGRKGSRKLT